MARLIALSVVLFVLAARPAAAANPVVGYAASFGAVAIGEAFPGYAQSSPDRGILGSAGVTASLRVRKNLKLGLDAKGGGQTFERFPELTRAWIGGTLSARTGATQIAIEPEWTPHRVKFPSVPEDAAFSRTGVRVGLRQGFGPALRLRVEGRFERDDFVSAFDARDSRERVLLLQLDGKPAAALTLRGSLELGATRANAGKYSHDDHAAGAGIAWAGGRWRLDSGLRSGISRYRLAGPSDSNYRRRDQWLEWSGLVARDLGTGLELGVRGQFTDQRSSRIERAYTAGEYRLLLSWTSPNP